MVVLAFAEGGAGIQLVPDGTILIHIALVLLMIWVLNRTFFRPINRVLAARDRNKGGHSAEAQEILKQVTEKSARYDAAMREARAESYKLVEAERSAALAERQTQVERVREEVTRTVTEERQAIEKQAEAARTALAAEAEAMARKISSNILK